MIPALGDRGDGRVRLPRCCRLTSAKGSGRLDCGALTD
jgi:hypothetical protein